MDRGRPRMGVRRNATTERSVWKGGHGRSQRRPRIPSRLRTLTDGRPAALRAPPPAPVPRDTAGPPPLHPPTASAPRDTAGPPVSAPRVGARPRPRAREGLADGGSLGGSGWAGASGPCVSRGFAAPGPAPARSWAPAGSKAPAVCSHALGWPAGPPPPTPGSVLLCPPQAIPRTWEMCTLQC